VRGIGFEPTTSESAALGVTGAMKAAFGLRAGFFFAVFAIWTPWRGYSTPLAAGV